MKRKNITVQGCQDCPFNNAEWMSCGFGEFFNIEHLDIFDTNGTSEYSGFYEDEGMPNICPLLRVDGVQVFAIKEKGLIETFEA
jgi:hypothetical protein